MESTEYPCNRICIACLLFIVFKAVPVGGLRGNRSGEEDHHEQELFDFHVKSALSRRARLRPMLEQQSPILFIRRLEFARPATSHAEGLAE